MDEQEALLPPYPQECLDTTWFDWLVCGSFEISILWHRVDCCPECLVDSLVVQLLQQGLTGLSLTDSNS